MPNILNIVSDDLFRVDAYRSVFGITIQTPNIDALVARGTRFDRAFAAVAICGPSRTAVLSGMSPYVTKALDHSRPWTSHIRPGAMLQAKLAETHHRVTVGKMDHYYQDMPLDYFEELYDSPRSLNNGLNYASIPGFTVNYGDAMEGHAYPPELEGDLYDAQVVTRLTDYLDNYSGTKDWYAEAGFKSPHRNCDAPQRLFDAINLANIIQPADWPLTWDMFPFEQLVLEYNQKWLDPGSWSQQTIDDWKLAVRSYIVTIHWLDEQIGRLINWLDNSPYASDTVIIFWSDHGYHIASHGVMYKFTPYEEACSAHLSIIAPGQASRVTTEPASLVDIHNTILDYAGVPQTGAVGQSLRPIVEGGTLGNRVIPSFWFGSASARIGNRRIIAWADGNIAYYDMVGDQWQANPLPHDAQFQTDLDALIAACKDWGCLLVEKGAKVDAYGDFVSFLGDNEAAAAPSAFMSVSSLLTEGGRGHQSMYPLPGTAVGTVRIPKGVEDTAQATNISPGYSKIEIVGNSRSNRMRVPTWAGNIQLDLYGGEGNDVISGMTGAANLYGGDGDDILMSGQGGILDGGRGNDTLIRRGGNITAYGGPGDDYFQSNSAHTGTLWGGEGNDTFDVSANNTAHLDAGRDVVNMVGTANNRVVVAYRTGHQSIINTLHANDTIDLSDWSVLGNVSVTQDGSDVVISAGRESLRCTNTDAATVTGTITGATVA